uniref:Uncharacterized protein n=1 Tax=Fagus sylvatica TaxID=28930 RepID=A0A2N9H5L6_FAGSY
MAISGSHHQRLSGNIPATPLGPMDSSRSQESTAANGSSFAHVTLSKLSNDIKSPKTGALQREIWRLEVVTTARVFGTKNPSLEVKDEQGLGAPPLAVVARGSAWRLPRTWLCLRFPPL